MISMGIKDSYFRRIFDIRWKYIRLLRKLEYLTNCRKYFLLRKYLELRRIQLGTKAGYSIPINVFGPGIALPHRGDIIVNGFATVGYNCRVHVGVNIGTRPGPVQQAPRIGNNCYLGPGAKLFGNIVIGDNTVIAANAVVNKSFPDGNCTIGGIPAKIISTNNSLDYITEGWVE
jgi:serine O-acetyltransferase